MTIPHPHPCKGPGSCQKHGYAADDTPLYVPKGGAACNSPKPCLLAAAAHAPASNPGAIWPANGQLHEESLNCRLR